MGWMDCVNPYTGIPHNNENEQSATSCKNTDESIVKRKRKAQKSTFGNLQ